jgi:tetratricopeptide (TPR) repeat protein
MKTHHRLSGMLLGLLAVTLSGAVSPDAPEEFLRAANAAFARADFAAAVDLCTRAEERTLDPGLAAFNKGTALYQLGRYREAELHFRRCLEDAAGPRLARGYYNLGNALLQQTRGIDARQIREGIRFYEKCMTESLAEPKIAADAGHNLELARLMLLKAVAGKKGAEQPDTDSGNDINPPDTASKDSRQGDEGTRSMVSDPRGKLGGSSEIPGDAQTDASREDQSTPAGKGNLPPVPDQDELVSLSPEDAAEHLKRATQRIKEELKARRQQLVPPQSTNVMDW